LSGLGRSFVFSFIDPKGWKDIGIDTLRPLLERSLRVLVNFMYNDIKRCANQRRVCTAPWMDANSGNRYANSFAEAYVGESKSRAISNAAMAIMSVRAGKAK